MSDIPALISRGAAIKAQHAVLKAELDQIQQVLLDAGAGEHFGTHGEKVTVVTPSPKFNPDQADIEQIRELVDDDATFKKLFARSVVYAPVKGVRHVAAALLKPGKLARLNALCDKAATAFVLWPK